MEDRTGRFVWYDLMTSDPAGATAFYPAIMGWTTQAWDNNPYTMWMVNGTHVGGVMELDKSVRDMGVPPHWLLYIGVADVDATTAKAVSVGGKVMVNGRDIPGIGRFAILTDPQGAAFVIWKSANPGGTPATGNGTMTWHELVTTDANAGFEFYQALFAWQKTEAMDMGPQGTYQMYGAGGQTYGGMYNKSAEMPMPPNWLAYVQVPDINAAAAKVKELGGQVMNGPMQVPGGDWIAQCMDPQGAAFAIHSKASS